MSCENCGNESELEKKVEEFKDRLRALIEEYHTELPAECIAFLLILGAKIEMCSTSPCLYKMVGVLNCMLHEQIESMWKEWKPISEQEETNAPDTM